MKGYTLVTIMLTIQNIMADSSSDETGCLYTNVQKKYSDCVRNNLNDSSLQEVMKNLIESDITGEELLSQLSTTCRNEDYVETYMYCSRSAIVGCPQLASIVTNDINEHVSVFCENRAPSTWINAVSQNGYFQTKRCTDDENVSTDVFIRCSDETNRNWSALNTVEETISAIQTARQEWFQCLVDRAPSLPDGDSDGVLDCGSSWQDVVQTIVLWYSSLEQIGVHIGEEEINELLTIKGAE